MRYNTPYGPIDYKRITKREFYDLGGFANGNLFRKGIKNGHWRYFKFT